MVERVTVPLVHVAETSAERRVLAHVRGWVHDAHDCALCCAELREVMQQENALAWRVTAQRAFRAHAEVAAALMVSDAMLESIISG